ncbi:MAG: TIGR02266 family protein [Deltaproteobacteria bacterium]|nr:TIGR02266 family protein [Deltaproteobacteria bacterium]
MFHVASEESYEDGQLIIEEGGAGDWIYVVLSGRVELSKMVGQKKYVIEFVKPGELFGELGFFGGIARAATAQAVGATRVGVIDRTSMDDELNGLSPGLKTVLATTLNRLKSMVDRASVFSGRSKTRVPVSLPVTYRDEDSFFKVVTGDLSGGGLFIRSDRLLEVGEKFLVNLRLPERTNSVIIKCEVVWVKEKALDSVNGPPGMGVKFINMTEEDREALEKYLEDLPEAAVDE